ncbi:MAG: glycosyltransferase [Acidobacteriota bacterium]
MERQLDIVMCFDRRHVPGLLAALRSMARHCARPEALDFHFVVAVGEAAALRADLERAFPSPSPSEPSFQYEIVEFAPPASLLAYIESGRAFTYADPAAHALNFSRFHLHRLFPELGKIIYLDADVIVQGDLAELDRLATLDAFPLAAVPVRLWREWTDGFEADSVHLPLIDMNAPMFNAGVYVTDLERWREEWAAKVEAWIDRLRPTPGDFAFGTQSVMNLVFNNQFEHLPASWNVRALGHDTDLPRDTLATADLLHWAGRHKPWLPTGLYREYWLPYATESI